MRVERDGGVHVEVAEQDRLRGAPAARGLRRAIARPSPAGARPAIAPGPSERPSQPSAPASTEAP